jgi:L,D-transpeptidase YcbB
MNIGVLKKNFFLNRFLILLILIIGATGCNSNPSSEKKSGVQLPLQQQTPATDTLMKGNFHVASGIVFDSNAISKFIAAKPAFKEFRQDFINFYRANKYNYVWYDDNGMIEPAHVLANALETQQEEGVEAKIPYREEYIGMINQVDTSMGNEIKKPDINTELMLTGQYFNYAKNVWAGAASGKVEGWYLPRKKLSYDSLLIDNLNNPTALNDENTVVIPQHNGLKKALTQYRDMEKKGVETKVPSLTKPSRLKPGDSSTIISAIRKRLNELSYQSDDNGNNYFDPALVQVINIFKQTHGLTPDSIINNVVIKELNVPLRKRIEQIIVNMERFRWVPLHRKSREFLVVNIPAFTLNYFVDSESVWNCRVVVGKPMTKTVIFSGNMQYVVFSPYWNVPPSIINKEIRPGMKRNPNYLANHNMEWNGGRVRQKPGPRNSLGLVKFLFPNSNNIYLHDTPSKSLFAEDARAFSHGCIRVSEPRELAIRVLRQDSSWTEEKIDKAMHAGVERYVTLKTQIPVYIGYFTAFIDRQGNLNFRDDIYKRDPELLALLMR